MRYVTFMLALLLFACTGCEKENFLRYSNSKRALKLIPTVNDKGIRFFTLAGDTITIKTKLKNSAFTTVENFTQNVGSTDGISKLELEKNTLVIGCDTPYFRFRYNLEATLDETQKSGTRDEFTLAWEDTTGVMDSKLNLTIYDSVQCADAACLFDTPLSFGSATSFTNVYFTPRSAGKNTRIFINETQGLVAFTLANGITYQRIP